MATAEQGFMKKLAVYATLAVLAHAVIVVWHLFVLAKIPPGSPVNRFCRRLSRSMWPSLWDRLFSGRIIRGLQVF